MRPVCRAASLSRPRPRPLPPAAGGREERHVLSSPHGSSGGCPTRRLLPRLPSRRRGRQRRCRQRRGRASLALQAPLSGRRGAAAGWTASLAGTTPQWHAPRPCRASRGASLLPGTPNASCTAGACRPRGRRPHPHAQPASTPRPPVSSPRRQHGVGRGSGLWWAPQHAGRGLHPRCSATPAAAARRAARSPADPGLPRPPAGVGTGQPSTTHG